MQESKVKKWLKRFLCPRRYAERITGVSLLDLKEQGIKGLIVDLDNTLAEWGREELGEETLSWLEEARAAGFRICVVSNNKGERLQRIAAFLQVPVIEGATKPRKKAFRQAMNLLGLSARETAVIGDQVFTDVLGGNRAGLFTVLVSPLSTREFIGTRLMRIPEKMVLKWLGQKGEKDRGAGR